MLVGSMPLVRNLAARAVAAESEHENGWDCASWTLDAASDAALLASYEQILLTDMIDPAGDDAVSALLADYGINLPALLLDTDTARDETVRADVTEIAASVFIASHATYPLETLHMANYPKLSRRKSESGVDAAAVVLDTQREGDLVSDERLVLLSVKHTVGADADRLRRDLLGSIAPTVWTPAYLARQLLVYAQQLRGTVGDAAARRVLLFTDPRHTAAVEIALVGVMDVAHTRVAMESRRLLPAAKRTSSYLHILMNDLRGLHLRAP